MTNTHINVGGHKITTNKVGQVHTATLINGATGTVKWCITNGTCHVYLANVKTNGAGTITISNDMPKAKLCGQNANVAGDAYVYDDTTLLNVGNYGADALYFAFDYPVADDWVES